MRFSFLAGLLAPLILSCPPGVLAQDIMEVGVAQVDITPSYPIRLTGYADRKRESDGVEQPLRAKALAICDSEGPAVLLTVDNCGVRASQTEEVAARLAKKIGLKRERFVVCSSHTHTGPALAGTLPMLFGGPLPADQQQRIERYTRELIDNMEKVALVAIRDTSPARLSWTGGTLGFAANRRVLKDGRWVGFGVTADAPTDHDMPMLRVNGPGGKLRAVLLSYACHCTTLGGDTNKICGDWVGYAQEMIERDNPGVLALIAIGCGADANPEPRLQLEFAKDHGAAVAREVKRLLQNPPTRLQGPIIAKFRRIELPYSAHRTREEWEDRAKRNGPIGYHARVHLERLGRNETPPKTLEYPVQTWTFGQDLAMVFLGGEVVVDYSQRLKRELDSHRLWISAYCNDVPCYIPSQRILKEGGYEADESMIYYDRPTRLAPETEDLIIKTVRELVPAPYVAPVP